MSDVHTLVEKLVGQHGCQKESLMPILQGVVDSERYVSDHAMIEIARELDISAAEVYGTATFYSFLDTQARGKYIIRICKTISCSMKGKNQILLALEDSLKIKLGETTDDKKFTLLETNCLGWCHKGPAMLINGEIYADLTPESARQVIEDYKKKETSIP